jgi:uroporphyrinogen decarboxylase
MTDEMNSRKRILTTLNHEEADRIPLDLASTQVTGISILAYQNLRKYLGFSETFPVIPDRLQQICIPDDDIVLKFGVDVKGLWPLMNSNDFIDHDDGTYLHHIDEWGLGYRLNKVDGLWYDLYISPMQSETISPAFLDNYVWPEGGSKRRIEGLREQAIDYQKAGYPVFLKSVCAGLLEMAIRLRGMENYFLDLLTDKQNASRLLDKILKVKIDYWETALDQLGDVVDIIAEADDFGTQASQLISHEVFREIIKPRQVELISFMKRKAPQAKIFFHSCGNIRPILPDFIEMGVDIINPVHIRAEGMAPELLKRDFGRDVVFWGGGVDTQDTLPHGTPQQVRDEVKRNIDWFAPGGGFVFNTIHNIQADVPPENIVAMYETVLEYGIY